MCSAPYFQKFPISKENFLLLKLFLSMISLCSALKKISSDDAIDSTSGFVSPLDKVKKSINCVLKLI